MDNKTYYHLTCIESPAGPVSILDSVRGVKIIKFVPLSEMRRMLHQKNIPFLIVPHETCPAATQLNEYFAGKRKTFDLRLDICGTPFQTKVWNCLRNIPYGQVRTYREIAACIGHPRSWRAVGCAARANPLPVVIPCHRVIRSDGTLSGYSGGIKIKEALLRIEGFHL